MAYRTIDVPQDVSAVLETLWRAGYPAYVVGGCVRDSLLGRVPADWDICTAATPDEMRAVFAGETLIATGEKHGTMTLVRCGVPYEITAFRSEGEYRDARHPESVRFGATLKEDLARRDFTVNALAFSPRDGLVDEFEGIADLRAHLLRCVGQAEQRFAEDALRIARAARFVAQLGFSMEPATERAAFAQCGMLSAVSPERVRAELERLLCGAYAGAALRMYGGLFAAVLPPLPAWTGDAVAACPDDLTTRLAVLVHACGEGFLYSLRFPGETAFAAAAAAAYLNAPPDASRESVRRTLHRLGVHGAQVYAAARAAVCAAKHDDAGTREASAFWSAMRTALAEGDCYSLAQLQVNGTDVMEAGVRPGRDVGRVLSRLLDEVMRGILLNERSVLLARLRTMIQEESAEDEESETVR